MCSPIIVNNSCVIRCFDLNFSTKVHASINTQHVFFYLHAGLCNLFNLNTKFVIILSVTLQFLYTNILNYRQFHCDRSTIIYEKNVDKKIKNNVKNVFY